MPESYQLSVNGTACTVEAEGDTLLLYILRNDLKLKGARYGCGVGQCGACAVLADGKEIRSCITPLSAVVGKEITTIEGLAGEDGTLSPVQQAWADLGVPQCGYCQSGQVIAATALLNENPNPTDDEIREGMAGHLCRCGTYTRIFQGVKNAAAAGKK